MSKENLSARKGGYQIAGDDKADAVIFATGSEVAIAVDALALLKEKGISAKVVSVPSLELFVGQPDAYTGARDRHAQGARRDRSRASSWAGASCWARRAASWACTRSAPARRRKSSTSTSASRPKA